MWELETCDQVTCSYTLCLDTLLKAQLVLEMANWCTCTSFTCLVIILDAFVAPWSCGPWQTYTGTIAGITYAGDGIHFTAVALCEKIHKKSREPAFLVSPILTAKAWSRLPRAYTF